MRNPVAPVTSAATRLAVLALPILLAACAKPNSIGVVTEILVATTEDLWGALETDLKAALEPRMFTVRNERVFDVAFVDPSDDRWTNLRYQRQVLVIGAPGRPVVDQALDAADGPPPTPPAILQAKDVWANNQLVTILLLPEGESPEVAREKLAELGEIFLSQFEAYARARMFATPPNNALADSLRARAGFSLVVPRVYRYSEREPGVHEFRNDQPDPSSLIRNITVASRPLTEVELSAATARTWRAELATRLVHPPQVTEEAEETPPVQLDNGGVQVQGVWSNPPGEWPAAGPFITRLIPCGDHVFLIDAWLYAPQYPKYEYMFQLNTILNSFECA